MEQRQLVLTRVVWNATEGGRDQRRRDVVETAANPLPALSPIAAWLRVAFGNLVSQAKASRLLVGSLPVKHPLAAAFAEVRDLKPHGKQELLRRAKQMLRFSEQMETGVVAGGFGASYAAGTERRTPDLSAEDPVRQRAEVISLHAAKMAGQDPAVKAFR